MQKFLEIIAKTLSVVLHPLLMPTYGMLLFAWTGVVEVPPLFGSPHGTVCLVGTPVITAIIPLLMFLLMWKTKHISSLRLDNATERSGPYICCIICFAFWCCFMYHQNCYQIMLPLSGIGAIAALTIVLVVNRWWKISAHLIGIGGLLGGVCSFGLWEGRPVTQMVVIVLILSLLLMYARIYLRAHTPLQVVCGFLLGIVCTIVPNWIMILICDASI